ncbi:hypothetical protein SLEP1_g44467 [Rubroshorea leprosula]|uniref:RRM domain-containing protein n=1 Tax=Rubroshorea leprosula TaxID=152421 RepID=A0AAV5LGA7_9ROSI|nr:hypothetical protein SLEP1_g44467 [Rubroshorea leprosula]
MVANNMNGNRTNTNLIQHESSLFSSSLSEIFSRKLQLLRNDAPTLLPSFKVGSDHEEEPLESLEEIEVQAIGNLLPDEDDLFSGVMGLDTPANRDDELEDFDLFSSGGGVESEGDDRLGVGQGNLDIVGASNGSIVGGHPSRTLFVRNINSNVEDSKLKALFEQYGDIRALYTACKHRGFATISYYDIRAAQNATRALQNKPLRHRKLDIHYSIPKVVIAVTSFIYLGTLVVFNLDASVSTNWLQQIFGIFGEIKINEISPEQNHKFIEFYDVRAAEAALCALNRCDIAGKQIEIEPSPPGGLFNREMRAIRCFLVLGLDVESFMQLSDQGQDESSNLCQSSLDDSMARHVAGVSASGYMDNGSSPILQNVIRSPVNTFIGPSQSSSVPINLSSPARVASVNNQFNLREPNHTLDVIKFQNQCITSFHPQSFPEYHDNLGKSLPSNSSSTIPDMVSSFVSQMTDELDNRSIHGVSTNGHSIEPNEGENSTASILLRCSVDLLANSFALVFGSSGNGSCLLHGNRYAWNYSNSHQQQPSSGRIWPNSPSFVNGVQHMPAFPRVPPVMLNAASPVHHHIESAPPVNSPLRTGDMPMLGNLLTPPVFT